MARRIPPRHQNKPKIRVKVKIKKDDTVKIIAGRDRGKTGRVLQVDAVKGKVLTLTVVNPHLTEARPARIMLRGDASAAAAETEVLGGGDVHEHNTFDQPNAVATKTSTASVSGKVVQFTLPPSSVTRLTITLS